MTLPTVTLAEHLEALVAAGDLEGAARAAIHYAKREALSPVDPEESAKRDYLSHAELSALSQDDVTRLRTEQPAIYQKSLRMLSQKPAVS